MRFVEAKTRDILQKALAIRHVVFVDEQKVPASLEQDSFDVLGSSSRHFVVFEKDRPVAAARVIFPFEEKDKVKIQRVAVLKDKRGFGVGRYLMQEIHNAMPQIQEFVLGSQCTAIPFYETLGYSVYGEEYFDANIPHRMMRLKRNPNHATIC